MDDNNENLSVLPKTVFARPNWFSGGLDFSANRSNWDINANMTNSPIWSYVGKAPGVFQRPADHAMVKAKGQMLPRRAKQFHGPTFRPLEVGSLRLRTDILESHTDMTDPGPSMVWVLLDEHPDSINDAAFANQMVTADKLSTAHIIDFPASYHNGACGFSFADGHSEIKKWKDGRTIAPVKYTGTLSLNVASPNNKDVLWFAERTTSK